MYYVGRASDLVKRIKDHLNDQHANLWTHFSAYFVKKASFASDIESIMITIAQPKGNKQSSNLKNVVNLSDRLKQKLEKMKKHLSHRESTKNNSKTPRNNKSKLTVPKDTTIKAEYQKRGYPKEIYEATLLTSGKVKYENKIYNSPTDAAKAITLYKSQNGLRFWSIKYKGKWVKLNEYKKSINRSNYQKEFEISISTKNKSNVVKMRSKKQNLRINNSQLHVSKDTIIKAEYQKRGCPKETYEAILLTSGKVKYKGKLYNSPTEAAKAITGYKSQNGLRFWSIQYKGEWIKLDKYKKLINKRFKSV